LNKLLMAGMIISGKSFSIYKVLLQMIKFFLLMARDK
jgi:hypothetical protein